RSTGVPGRAGHPVRRPRRPRRRRRGTRRPGGRVVNVSVLCPSRGRGASLAKSAETLTALAADPSMIEILVAVDPDDEATAQAASFIPARVKVWRAPQRYGYARLHEYY